MRFCMKGFNTKTPVCFGKPVDSFHVLPVENLQFDTVTTNIPKHFNIMTTEDVRASFSAEYVYISTPQLHAALVVAVDVILTDNCH